MLPHQRKWTGRLLVLVGILEPHATTWGGDPPARVELAAPARKFIEVRSVRPVPEPAAAAERVVTYGLTDADLDRLGALPAVARAVPVRYSSKPARYLERAIDAEIVGTITEFMDFANLELARGRFLRITDNARVKNYVVLGPAVAETLFPDEDAVGKVIEVGSDNYTVLGVAKRRPVPPAIGDEDTLDRAVYLPLSTSRLRFGAEIISVNPFQAEENPLSRIILELRFGSDVEATAAQARDDLKRAHPRGDFEVIAPRPDPEIKRDRP